MPKKIEELFVEVQADLDKLDATLRQAESKVMKSGERMDSAAQKGINRGIGRRADQSISARSAVRTLARSAVAVNALATGFKGMNRLIERANEGTLTFQNALGDLNEVIKSLPFGLGALATELERFVDQVQQSIRGIKLEQGEGNTRGKLRQRRSRAADRELIQVEGRIKLLKEEDKRQQILIRSTLRRAKITQEFERRREENGLSAGEGRLLKGLLREERERLKRELADFDKRAARINKPFVNTIQTFTGAFKFAQGAQSPVLQENQKQTKLQESIDKGIQTMVTKLNNLSLGGPSAAFT